MDWLLKIKLTWIWFQFKCQSTFTKKLVTRLVKKIVSDSQTWKLYKKIWRIL